MRVLLALLLLAVSSFSCHAQRSGFSAPDPYVLQDCFTGVTFKQPAGLTPRPPVINPSLKTAIVNVTGQSLPANVVPSAHAPSNASVVDQLNICDGQLYSITGPLLGSSLSGGNVMTWFADSMIAGGWDRVILVDMNIGSTTIAQWATGIHAGRLTVAMGRLKALGIVPGMTGVTFLNILAVGNDDLGLGTSQAAFSASLATYIATTQAVMPSSRIFVCLDSGSGQTSNAIRSAQAASWNGSTVVSCGDIDSSTIATSDGVHPSNAGAPTMATIMYNGVHASGAPFLYLPPYAANDNWQALLGCNDNTADLCKAM